jgi:hypothetical protein
VTAASPEPPRPLRHDVTGRLVRLLAGWLEPPEPEAVRDAIRTWASTDWAALRRVVLMHGLSSHLADPGMADHLAGALPSDVRSWLAAEDERIVLRLRRMHDELAAILRAADAAGIEVMPLKGALLTSRPGSRRRSMADLDLLVHATDREPLGRVLVSLGYRLEPEPAPRPTHDVYVDPGGGRIVSYSGEHPDNPRRVEVHVEVLRHLWGWTDDDQLTPALWEGARTDSVVGEPARIPTPDALLAHLAIHASSDLLVGRGRLVQWLDLADNVGVAGDPADLPHPSLAYPALRLATRAMPRSMAAVDLGGIEAGVPPRLARWATTVSFDRRAGLTDRSTPGRPDSMAARWRRWRPEPWRLAVAYGDRPLPVALARHGLTIARLLAGRMGRSGSRAAHTARGRRSRSR